MGPAFKDLELHAGQPRRLGQDDVFEPPGIRRGRLDRSGRVALIARALLLGYYRDDGKLIYAGRAGTGLTESELRALLKKLRPLVSDKMTVYVTPPKTSRFGKPLRAYARALGTAGAGR